jgi:hypothetical protein
MYASFGRLVYVTLGRTTTFPNVVSSPSYSLCQVVLNLGKPPSGLLRFGFEHNLSKPEGGLPRYTNAVLDTINVKDYLV